MKRPLIIGCGDVAMRAIPLLTRRYGVFALVRNPAYRENYAHSACCRLSAI